MISCKAEMIRKLNERRQRLRSDVLPIGYDEYMNGYTTRWWVGNVLPVYGVDALSIYLNEFMRS